MNHTCHDCELPADPKYTMDFTDVRPDTYIYFCEAHGEIANAMNEALLEAFATRPDFAAVLEAEIAKAKQGDA
jgi:hypothetical protein